MSIIGVGVDIIEIERIKKSIQRMGQHFLDRLFTEEEQAYCLTFQESERHFAGRFAAKEAIAKALGTGIEGALNWKDVAIHNSESGRPHVILSKRLQEKFPGISVHLSISHNRDTAVAFAVASQTH